MSYICIQKIIKFKRNLFLFYYEILLFLFEIAFVGLIGVNDARKFSNYFSEIKLIIQGFGHLKLLKESFKYEPSEVFVNNKKNDSCNKNCFINGGNVRKLLNITLRFEKQIDSCESMFEGLTNIIEIDLSDFDASKGYFF